jgi:hypothetical protein
MAARNRISRLRGGAASQGFAQLERPSDEIGDPGDVIQGEHRAAEPIGGMIRGYGDDVRVRCA